MDDAPTPSAVELNGIRANLRPCRPLVAVALARDHERLQQNHALWYALASAALRECWPDDVAWPVRVRPVAWKVRQPIEEYGAEVFEGLIAGGCKLTPVRDVLRIAYDWAMDALLSADEVQAAVGFSGAPAPGA